MAVAGNQVSEEIWQPARLIPVAGIRGQEEQEQRATSALLAVMGAVPEFIRTMKSPELEVRPVHNHLDQRVRAHAFLCMLAYAVRFELEERLAELLFKDDTPLAPLDPVAPAQRSAAAKRKAGTKRTQNGLPASSFRDLLDTLATLCRNRVRLRGSEASFDQLTEANPLQKRALELLDVNPNRL